MTQSEFDNYKLQIQYISSKMAAGLCNQLVIGKGNLNNDKINLELLNMYLEIMQTYDLELESVADEDTINFFTKDQMQDIVTHINKICNTHYNIDFILEI